VQAAFASVNPFVEWKLNNVPYVEKIVVIMASPTASSVNAEWFVHDTSNQILGYYIETNGKI
jgi:hypothetical protein